jgi:hypothetical protein
VSRIKGRVARLAGRPGPGPCRECHWWERSMAVCDDKGTCSRPEVCPECGRVVPIGAHRLVVGVDLGAV